MSETEIHGLAWVIFFLREVIPHIVREGGLVLGEAIRGSPWWTALAILVALGVWKLLELVLSVLRKAWIPILAGLGIGLATLAVRS